jgi:hypothetical protein
MTANTKCEKHVKTVKIIKCEKCEKRSEFFFSSADDLGWWNIIGGIFGSLGFLLEVLDNYPAMMQQQKNALAEWLLVREEYVESDVRGEAGSNRGNRSGTNRSRSGNNNK